MVLEWLSMHWQVICGFVGVGIWVGMVSQRVTNLEHEPKVTISSCDRQQASCRAHIDSEFAHGSKDFAEIKSEVVALRKSISAADAASQDRHREILNILLERN